MLNNMNPFERRVRILTGCLIWTLYLTGAISGGYAHFLAVVGVILLSTGIINCCPYYLAFEFSTNKSGIR